MRRLSFGTEQKDRDRFDIIYSGICASDRGIPRTDLNTFNRLVDKLEGIAKPIEGAKEDAIVRFELGDKGGEVLLENPEFALLNAMHHEVRWKKIVAKQAEETYLWLEALPDEVLKKQDASTAPDLRLES